MPKLAPETQNAKRTHILDAAERCFTRSGFHRASMQDICAEAGVSAGAFYRYFSSKEELIAGICERECATFADMLAATSDAEDLVEALTGLAGQSPVLNSPEKLRLHADIAAEATRNPAVAQVAHSSDAFIIKRFEDFLSSARDAGKISPQCDISTIARTFRLIGDGLFHYCAQNAEFDPGSIRPALDVIVKALLNPVAVSAGEPVSQPADSQSASQNQKVKNVTKNRFYPALGGLAAFGLALLSAASAHSQTVLPSQAPVVTVTPARVAPFSDTVMVTGSLAPREEVLVGPEIEGLRIVELLVEEGDEVKKGQVLARLSRETLETQLAQNAAGIARAVAAIEQARLMITETEAQETQADADFNRAEKLRQTGDASVATFDLRQAAARASKAKAASARRGLALAEAEKAQLDAQRRELEVRLDHTNVKAPAAGIISRRAARLGALASSGAEPLFRIVAKGEVELDAEVAETHLPKLAAGMTAHVEIAGLSERAGRVRLIMPEVDRSTRLGRVRIFLGDDRALHIGSFGRAIVKTASSKGIAVPAGSVLYGPDGPMVQVVKAERVETRLVSTGLAAGDAVEIRSGLNEGEMVVARAGAFLRDGDAVRPVMHGQTTLSETTGEPKGEQR